MTTPVIFRAFLDKPKEVIAMFPTLAGDSSPATCLSYQSMGQHGAASVDLFYTRTRPATPYEYIPLMKELEQIGYDDLRMYRRYQPAFTSLRLNQLTRSGGAKL